MQGIKEIVEEYRSADEDKRLSLFLTYRDLRDEFMDIEMTLNPRPEPRTSKASTPRSWMSYIKAPIWFAGCLCFNFFKKSDSKKEELRHWI